MVGIRPFATLGGLAHQWVKIAVPTQAKNRDKPTGYLEP
jgi:hypothetical protein